MKYFSWLKLSLRANYKRERNIMQTEFPDFYRQFLKNNIARRGIKVVRGSLAGKRDRAYANAMRNPIKKKYYLQWAERHENALAALETDAYKRW